MNSTASLYQIDDRSLELRRSYMRVTRAELDLLAGMRAWADRNAEAIGTALAEHTFSSGASGSFLRSYATARASSSTTSSAAGAAPTRRT